MAGERIGRQLMVVIALSILIPGGGVAVLVTSSRRAAEAQTAEAECLTHLTAIGTAQRHHFEKYQKYATDFDAPFLHEAFRLLDSSGRLQPPRYTFVMGATKRGTLPAEGRVPPLLGGVTPGLMGQCPVCEYAAMCVANIDADPQLDVWSVTSLPRALADGGTLAPGQPFHDAVDRD
jgi:hypothetical protein